MSFLYNLFIFFYRVAIYVASFTGNVKAKLWISGRKNGFDRIQQKLNAGEQRIWFHCASLGEFEQGRPVIEKFRLLFPDYKVVLTFFSPSGYEVRKNYSGADYIFYLPIDTRANARKFISLVNPEKVFFVKYEYWYYYFDELKKRNIQLFLLSAIFRPGQRFFQWYGYFFRHMLKSVSHFFVQDDQSATLLNSIGITNSTVTGDTRFDRVVEVAAIVKSIPLIEKFMAGKKIMIAGSTWEKDEQLLRRAYSELRTICYKLIIVPHEINEKRIDQLIRMLSDFKVVKFSEAKEETISSAEILVIDNIGMLSSLYQYGSLAYIGGGFGSGIHNILEAAVFGMPVFFGPNYQKFREANELVACGGAFSINSFEELKSGMMNFFNEEKKLSAASSVTKKYVHDRKGATENILEFVKGK